MYNHKTYTIKNDDQFEPDHFPVIKYEMLKVLQQSEQLSGVFKAEMIVSFLKDHSLQNEWIQANPALTTLMLSNTLFDGSTTSLFDACRDNLLFRKQLETYLLKILS